MFSDFVFVFIFVVIVSGLVYFLVWGFIVIGLSRVCYWFREDLSWLLNWKIFIKEG